MEQFAAGNRAFREEFYPKYKELFGERLQEQHPVAMYIGCSDSRVPIESITGAMLGDLYVMRNTGNIVPPSYYADACVGAAVEHAVQHLEVGHVIVCGHYGCGAIAALAEGQPGLLHYGLHLSNWLNHTRPILGRVKEVDPEARSRRLVEENVRQQLENLRTYTCVKEAEEAGRLCLHAWVYDWDSGRLLEARGDGEFRPL